MTPPVFEFKVVFAGPMGAGKTTAIRTISDREVISTDVINSDLMQSDKALTTVALDYGEVALRDGLILKLFGTPGQVRFDFMWPSIAQGALGLIILIDHTRPDPMGDLDLYLAGFSELAATGRVVVGVGRTQQDSEFSLDRLRNRASRTGLAVPVFAVDVRHRHDVRFLLEVLAAQIEFGDVRDLDLEGRT